MIDQQRNVIVTVTQRGWFNMENVETVEEIGTEFTFFDQLLEIFIGGGDATEINLDGLGAADANYFMLLQNAEKISLCFKADVADFVEEDRSTFGDFKFAFLTILSAGEGTFFVPE